MGSSRRWPWIVFAACVLLVLEGLGYVTWRVLTLERAEREARASAAFEQSLRLALWRADAAATPIIAAEAARPYFEYLALYPTSRPYDELARPIEPGEPVAASPLLNGLADGLDGGPIRLHFQIRSGRLESPQVPQGRWRELAIDSGIDADAIARASAMLTQLELIKNAPELANAGVPTASGRVLESLSAADESTLVDAEVAGAEVANAESANTTEAADAAEVSEFNARQLAFERAVSRSPPVQARAATALALEPGDGVQSGPFVPSWRRDPASGRDELLYTRSVRVGGEEIVQGFWVDWPGLRQLVLEDVADLLAQAELVPLPIDAQATGSRLASVPARLRATMPEVVRASWSTTAWSPANWSPTRWTLALTWAAVLIAIASIGIVLRKAIELGERRGRFVSAVTHELRTPMTTFKLYTQMLAGGMVTDEGRKQQYIRTLDAEASRLGRIVENVLEFARLNRPGRERAGPVAISELIEQCATSLAEIATQADMDLKIDVDAAGDAHAGISADTFERIVRNLVENAARYASDASDRRIELRARGVSGVVRITVRDYGPGIAAADRKRIFKPFSRARADEDGPAGGLGLGLSLSRGLAERAGGSLALVEVDGPGACFELTLPASDPAPDPDPDPDPVSSGGPGS